MISLRRDHISNSCYVSSVRFNITPKKAELKDNISLLNAEGYSGEGFFATSMNTLSGLARKNSIWPLPFATSCCGIEFMETMASHYDFARFGAERLGFSSHVNVISDVMGTCEKMGPIVKQVITNGRTRWSWPWCMRMHGGIFDSYSVLQGIDQVVRLMYIVRCPPRPEAFLMDSSGFTIWSDEEKLRQTNSEQYKTLLQSYGIQ